MKYAEALTALIDQRWATTQRVWIDVPGIDYPTRDMESTDSENILIGTQVMGESRVGGVRGHFGDNAGIEYGTFDNCREYGLTVTTGDWTFCAYEHRNSDQICIEGCPTADVQPYGPYGGQDKYDVLAQFEYGHYYEAAQALVAMLEAVREGERTRADLKALV